MKEKVYTAYYDDGHDYGTFEFYSKHRANSKANIKDAKLTATRRYGARRSNQIRITSTILERSF